MNTPSYTPCADAQALRAAIAPWLAADPVTFSLICGIAERLVGNAGAWAGIIRVAESPRLALVQTPPHAVILASPAPVDAACVDCAAALLRARTGSVHRLMGPTPWAEALVAALGVAVVARMGVRLHRLVGAPRMPRQVAGQVRAFHREEDDLLWSWHESFEREVEPGEAVPTRDPATMERVRSESVAWTVDGHPVSMARRCRPLLGGWCIAGVYTPPHLRGRGYAGAVVHGLSAKLVAEGASYVSLFTDLANPIPNRLYARIGFVPCLDQTRLSWNPS